MNLLSLAYTGFKCVLLSILCFVIWFIYKMVIRMWFIRRKYLKYPNCELTKKFHPCLGDFAVYLDNKKNNKFIYSHFIDSAVENNKADMRLVFFGEQPKFYLISLKAHKEFLDMVPNRIDRSDQMKYSRGRIGKDGLGQTPTNDKSKLIRSEFIKAIGFNQISNRIPDIEEIFERSLDTWPIGEEIIISEKLKDVTFEVINHLLFGKDASSLLKECKYINPDKSESILGFDKMLMRILDDILKNYFSAKFLLNPLLAHNNLIEPFKTNKKNIDNMNDALLSFSMKTTDDQSTLNKVISSGKLDRDAAILNVKGFLVGGIETSAKCLTSLIYHLSKYPDCYNKLIEQLKISGVLNSDGSLNSITKENIYNCDYLNYVVKEALRIDPPASETLPYKALEDIEICGIPIPKNSYITLNHFARHYNSEEWQYPLKFIPERFDPTSPFFFKPGSSIKARDSLSYAPFSIGPRACGGQALALLEIKVGLVVLLSKFRFEIDETILLNDRISFTIGSDCKLKCKLLKS